MKRRRAIRAASSSLAAVELCQARLSARAGLRIPREVRNVARTQSSAIDFPQPSAHVSGASYAAEKSRVFQIAEGRCFSRANKLNRIAPASAVAGRFLGQLAGRMSFSAALRSGPNRRSDALNTAARHLRHHLESSRSQAPPYDRRSTQVAEI